MHRPRVEAIPLHPAFGARWGWRFECPDCPYRTPHGMLLTWPIAMRFAIAHHRAIALRARAIDAEVAKFRTLLDEAS